MKYLRREIVLFFSNIWGMVRFKSIYFRILSESHVFLIPSALSRSFNIQSKPKGEHNCSLNIYEAKNAEMMPRKFMTCAQPSPDLEEKSSTFYVTDPGKRQVICSTVDGLN